MVKTGWSYYPLRVCPQAVYFDQFMRTVRDIPTLRMETTNGSKKDLFTYLRRCKAAATTRSKTTP